MPWGRLDDGLYDHPKLDGLGPSKLPAVGLWTLAISWSNRRLTDGFIPADRVVALGGTKEIAELLVDVGMFDRAKGGYRIHDFLAFNETAETVRARREAAAERQRRHRAVTPDVTRDSEASAGLVTRDKQRDNGANVTPDVTRDTHARAQDRARPGPTDSESRPDSPQPPSPAGGRRSRANGTNPRAVEHAEAEATVAESRARKRRRDRRRLAYFGGLITQAQLEDMNERDAPLSELPEGQSAIAWMGQ